MCGRYSLSESPAEIAAAFEQVVEFSSLETFARTANLQPRFNIAPTQHGVVGIADNSRASLTLMRWGLIPHWAKDQKIGAKLINARAETVALKPSFRSAFKHRRCLVFADGYYEWTTNNGTKQPIYLKPLRTKVVAFAGLWEQWLNQDKQITRSYTIITTQANADIDTLHHRMPVVIAPEACAQWLSVESTPDQVSCLLQPAASGTFAHHFVSKYVNSPRNEGPQCTLPVVVE